MVEHLVYTERVGGSKPSGPTVPREEVVLHRLHCTRCHASWPDESGGDPSTRVCPVCSLEVTGNPNAHGSPSPAEDLLATELEPPA